MRAIKSTHCLPTPRHRTSNVRSWGSLRLACGFFIGNFFIGNASVASLACSDAPSARPARSRRARQADRGRHRWATRPSPAHHPHEPPRRSPGQHELEHGTVQLPGEIDIAQTAIAEAKPQSIVAEQLVRTTATDPSKTGRPGRRANPVDPLDRVLEELMEPVGRAAQRRAVAAVRQADRQLAASRLPA